jgi:septum site-determining protein MinD
MKNDTGETGPNQRSRSIAVVSGKGGSGKTMAVAVMARILSAFGEKVIIVDADTGTAGMTYYLGLKMVSNIRVGLSNVAKGWPKPELDVETYLQPIRDRYLQASQVSNWQFLGIGDHRRLEKEVDEIELPSILGAVIKTLRQGDSWIIIDCRGGIDRESIAVCEQADDIILISESDTTSFQATKHIVDVFSDNDLAFKIRGFVINKVFDDPTVLINQGTSVYGTQFLSAIPFDLKATRSFLMGEIPTLSAPFGVHVWAALNKAYPGLVEMPYRVWSPEDYREVGLSNLDSIRGGMFMAFLIALLGTAFTFYYVIPNWAHLRETPNLIIFLLAFFMLGLIGSVEGTRRIFGRIFSRYLRLLKKRSTRD